MIGKTALKGTTLLILCVLFATCGGSPVNDKGPTTSASVSSKTTETEMNATLKCALPARRVMLERDEYQMLPNGTLLVSNSSHSANASSYTVGGDGAATVCLPLPTDCEDDSVVRPFNYALLSVFFHLLAPTFVCLVRSFNRWSPLVAPVFLFFHLAVYFARPFAFPERGDPDLWYNLPSYLTVVTLHVAGAMTFLHSDYALDLLAGWRQIFARKGTVYVSNMAVIAKTTAFFAVQLFWISYVFAYCAAYGDDLTKRLRSSLPFFLPSSILYVALNALVRIWRHYGIPPATFDDGWRRIRQRYRTYSTFFICAFANWTFGLVIVVSEQWRLWEVFAFFSLILSLGLYWYVYENSRRVIYHSPECFKVLEMNGDVLTVWIHPPYRCERVGKQPANKETGAGKEEQPVDKESGTVGEKRPADKDYSLRFVVEGTGKDKELVMVVDGPDKDEARQLSREGHDVALYWYQYLRVYSIKAGKTDAA